MGKNSLSPKSPSFLIRKQHSNWSVVVFCGIIFCWTVSVPEEPLSLSNGNGPIIGDEILLAVRFHSSSPREVVFVRVYLFQMIVFQFYHWNGDYETDICFNYKLSDVEYVDNFVPLGPSEYLSKLQVLLHGLYDNAAMLEMHFVPSKGKMLFYDCFNSKPKLVPARKCWVK